MRWGVQQVRSVMHPNGKEIHDVLSILSKRKCIERTLESHNQGNFIIIDPCQICFLKASSTLVKIETILEYIPLQKHIHLWRRHLLLSYEWFLQKKPFLKFWALIFWKMGWSYMITEIVTLRILEKKFSKTFEHTSSTLESGISCWMIIILVYGKPLSMFKGL